MNWNHFLHSWDAWAAGAFVVMCFVLWILTRADWNALSESVPALAGDLKRAYYKPIVPVGITEECFQKLKRTGETEVIEGPDAILWVTYMETKPEINYAGEGCFILTRKP